MRGHDNDAHARFHHALFQRLPDRPFQQGSLHRPLRHTLHDAIEIGLLTLPHGGVHFSVVGRRALHIERRGGHMDVNDLQRGARLSRQPQS